MTDPIFATYAPLYWAAGLPVIPLRQRNKMPDILDWTAYGQRMPSELEQQRWMTSFPRGNVGLPLGPQSGVAIIDIDTEDEGLTAAILECLPQSPWKRVGKKGMALAYRFENQKNFKLRAPDGGMILEFLGQGNQCVMPPSIHPDTKMPYTANCNLWDVLDQLPELGEDIEDKLRGLLGAKGFELGAGGRSGPLDLVPAGERDVQMVRHAGYLARVVLGIDKSAVFSLTDAIAQMHHWVSTFTAQVAGDAMSPEKGIAKLFEFLLKDLEKGRTLPMGWDADMPEEWHHDPRVARLVELNVSQRENDIDDFPLTDSGNAQRLAQDFGGKVRWVEEAVRWVVWTGVVWVEDVDGHVERLAKAIGLRLVETAADEKSRMKWGFRSQSASAIRAMIQLVKSEPGVTISAQIFDTKLNVLNTPAGVVDLSTGTVRQAEPEDYFTQSTGIAFDPTADCPRWDTFLTEVQPDPEVAAYFQRLCGYIVTGLTREHIAVFASGAGRNGKSLSLNTVAKAVGDYSAHTRTETFMQRQSGAMSNDLAALNGPRLVLANESNRGQRLDTALMKGMTGGDPIQARFLRQEFVTFFPRFTPVIISNHLPEIDANDPAIWARLVILPFTRTFDEADQDKQLPQKLEAELPGILRWIVEGALQYHQQGLAPPNAIVAAVNGFRGEMDTIGAFLDECCTMSPTAECPATRLYIEFERYARELGVRVPTRTEFGMELSRRGIGSRKSSTVIRTGVALRPAGHDQGLAA